MEALGGPKPTTAAAIPVLAEGEVSMLLFAELEDAQGAERAVLELELLMLEASLVLERSSAGRVVREIPGTPSGVGERGSDPDDPSTLATGDAIDRLSDLVADRVISALAVGLGVTATVRLASDGSEEGEVLEKASGDGAPSVGSREPSTPPESHERSGAASQAREWQDIGSEAGPGAVEPSEEEADRGGSAVILHRSHRSSRSSSH